MCRTTARREEADPSMEDLSYEVGDVGNVDFAEVAEVMHANEQSGGGLHVTYVKTTTREEVSVLV